MKIILTGTTGFIGKAVLQYLLKSPYITHIYSLTRSPLPPTLSNHPKLTQIIQADLSTWPGPELQTLRAQGVNGCIWCLGGPVSKYASFDEAQTVNVSYAIAAAEAFVRDLIPLPSEDSENVGGRKKQPFRMVYMSVAWAEQNQFRWLVSNSQMRKMKGAAEKGLAEIADGENAMGMLEVYFLRLGRVLPGGQTMGNVATEAVTTSISAERVAKCAHDVVLDGRRGENGEMVRVLENKDCLGEDWADINTIS
ncbi:hypothetical protein MBLNU457_1698t1 [Dothideomycetes sp. NU457]